MQGTKNNHIIFKDKEQSSGNCLARSRFIKPYLVIETLWCCYRDSATGEHKEAQTEIHTHNNI